MRNRLQSFYLDIARSYYGPERYARRLKSSPGQLSLFDQPQAGGPRDPSFEQVHPRAVKGAPGGGRFVDKPGTAKQPLEPATKAKPLPKSGVESFDKDRAERAKLRADIEAGKDIPDHAFGRHNDLRELAENRRRQRAFAGEEEPAFHAMTKSEYQDYVESISPLPSDYFKIGDIPVVQNPTTDDYRAISKQVREEFPNMPTDTPKVRSTYDKRGNQWIWPAHKALHQHVEPDIERRVKAKVNQAFEIPKHSEYIRDALRQGLEIPQRVQAEYPQYAEFFSGKTKYDIGASMPTTTGMPVMPEQYFLQQVARSYYGPERYAKQLSLFDQPIKPTPKLKSVASFADLKPAAPADTSGPAKGWIRKKGARGATYWYNRITNPNDLPDGRIYQDSPPTKDQARAINKAGPLSAEPDLPDEDVMKQEQDKIRSLVAQGKQVPGSLARKHMEVVKEATAEKESQDRAKVQKERQQVRQALSRGQKVSPELAERHSDLIRIAESQRRQRLAQDPEKKAEEVKPRSIHKPPEDRLKAKIGEAVPKSGHIGIKEFPGKKFKYTIQNPNITNIPEHHDVLESRLVESNNELFRVSIVGTSHGKMYSQIEVGDVVDSAPSKQTVQFRPATPAETKVISSKTDTQSRVAAMERKMWKDNRAKWRSGASEPPQPKPESKPSPRELFAQAHAFAEAVCEKYAPRWNVGTRGRHTKGRPSPGQKSFDFAAEEHANVLRQWDFNEEIKHPRGGDGRWVKKHGTEQSDKPAPLFEHEKIDDIAELFQGDQPVNPKQITQILGKDWIDKDTAKQVMGKLGIDDQEQLDKMFYDQDTKQAGATVMAPRFASLLAQLPSKQTHPSSDYESLRGIFYDEDGDLQLPPPEQVKAVLGPTVDRKTAIEAMKAMGVTDKGLVQKIVDETFSRKGSLIEPQKTSEFAFQFFHWLLDHNEKQRWNQLAAQVPDNATVIVFAKADDPHGRKLILHPSTYKPGTWQLSRRDKDGPVGHSDHKTREAGLRAAIGVADHHLENEGDASYKLLWHNKSGEKSPFTLRTGHLQGAAVEFYSQVLMNLYGPERYATQLSLFEPAKPTTGSTPDPEHHIKHPHRPAGPGGGQFQTKPKAPESPLRDPAESVPTSKRHGYYRDQTRKAMKRTKAWDPNRPMTAIQQEVNDVAEDILNAANAGESISPEAQSKFSKRVGGYIRSKVKKTDLQEADRDDVVQNVFLNVWDKLTNIYESGRWDPKKGPFTRWLGSAVSRAIVDQIRFAEDRQGRERRGKVRMSELSETSEDGEEITEFESQIADREYRAAFSPKQWRGFMDEMFSLGVKGLTEPEQRRAVELYFGYGAPGEQPIEKVSNIARRIAFEKERRWDKESHDQDIIEKITTTDVRRIYRKIQPTLEQNGALWVAIRKMEELGRLDLEQFYDSPSEWLSKGDYSLHSNYALAYLLHKHRYHMADFLRRPERYMLAELAQPERYARPFDETKVQRGAKGDPAGKGGQFVPKHGGGGVEASDPHGSMTTATPSAAPSVPRLTPTTPPKTKGTSTVQSAVVLALLAAGALSGKRGLGAIASVAMPHLTKTMRTQARQAREVLKQNPHSDFGKQLAESARKIDAQIKASKTSEQKEKEAREKNLSKRIDAALKKERQKQKAHHIKLGRKRLSRAEQREQRLSDREKRLRKKEDRLQQGITSSKAGSSRKGRAIDAIEDKLKDKVVTELKQSTPGSAGFSGTLGSETTIRVHNRQPLNAQYGLMDLKDVQSSHNYFTGVARPNPNYPESLQPREYKTGNDNDAKVRDHASKSVGQEARYYISDSPDALNGPPTLASSGAVVNGNGRVHSLQLAAAKGEYDWYKDALVRDADRFRIDPKQVAEMEHPVLVRLTGLDEKSPEASEFARSGNFPPTQSENISRTGAGMNYLITDDTLNRIDIPDDSTLSDVLSKDSRHPLVREIWDNMPSSEKSRYFTDTQTLTAQGKDLVTEMLLSKFVPVDTLERLGEEHRSLKRGLEGAIPQLLKLGTNTGIRQHVNEAIQHMVKHPEDKTPKLVDQTLSQKTLDPRDTPTITPQARMLLDFFLTSKDTGGSINSRKVREGMTRLVKAMDERTKTLFGEHPLPEHEHAAEALGVEPREGAAFNRKKVVLPKKMSMMHWLAHRELYSQFANAYYGGTA